MDSSRETIKKLCHDLRGHLTVLSLNLELLQLSPEYETSEDLQKIGIALDKEIKKVTKLIEEHELKYS